MNRINEIGNTKKGQEMLGRTAERAYQRAQRTSGADKKRYEKTFSDAYRTGGKSANKHLGGSREHFDNGRDYEHEKWEKEHNGNVAESKNMNKKIIRLTESDLHRIVKESVNRILREDERHAWELKDDGIDEFGMDSGYPTPETAKKYHAVYDNDYIGRRINMARAMGQDQASGRDWMQNVHDPKHGSKFTNDDPRFRFARDYVNHGKYFPLGYSGGDYFDDNAEDDLRTFNKSERNKQAAADRRWMKAADSRPLYRKNSPNNDIPR